MSDRSPRVRKALRLTVGVFVVYALLVSTHLGEFWPFSIYPMFSRGGHPWSRAVVRTVPQDSALLDSLVWDPVTFEELPGSVYAMESSDINQNDLANFVSKSDDWTGQRVQSLRALFGSELDAQHLLVFRADGQLGDGRMVQVSYTPYVLLSPDTTWVNPQLEEAR